MYYYNGDPLRLDKAFIDTDGNQYPANWLRNSTQEQRDALGITWVAPDPAAYYDQRFYWGVGNPKVLEDVNPVDENDDPVLGPDGNQLVVKGLKSEWIAKQKQIAGSLLAPTDWYVIRMTEDATCTCPAEIAQYRADVRSASNAREAEITACVDVEELEALIKAAATIEVITQEYVPADGETPEVPEVRETQVNPAALTAWPVAV